MLSHTSWHNKRNSLWLFSDEKNLGNTGYLGILNRPLLPKNILQHQMWKESFFLILSDVFLDEWYLFLLLWMEKKKDNLDTKFFLWSLFCSSITHFLFQLSWNKCRINNGNPQRDSQRGKCYISFWGMRRWWGCKKRIFQLKSKYNAKDGILSEQNWNTLVKCGYLTVE